MESLTDRQRRELEYHKKHAVAVTEKFKSVDYDVVTSPARRWWNAYWDIWTFLIGLHVRGKKILVVGCGWGADALRFAKLGAIVSACDLSPEMMAHGVKLAAQDGLTVEFAEMPCERMTYRDGTFDIVFCRDILHHVDIPTTMREIARVAKPDALLVVDEIYSHSMTDWIRHSWLVERVLYRTMQRFIYKGKLLYITEDERKMTEKDIALVKSHVPAFSYHKYFNFVVTRIVPDNYLVLNKVDRLVLKMLGPIGYYIAGRIAFVGRLQSPAPRA